MKSYRWTLTQYAEARGRSVGWVSEQIDLGMPAIGKGQGARYTINPAEAIQWEVDRAAKKAEAEPESQYQRLQMAQAEKLELENVRRRKELVSAAYVRTMYDGLAAVLCDGLDRMTERLALDLNPVDPGVVRARILVEADAIRVGVANYAENLDEIPSPAVVSVDVPAQRSTPVGKRRVRKHRR